MKSKSMTKVERRRMEIVKTIGCTACYIDGFCNSPSHAHHIVSCGSRLGHMATYGLCDDHHVGNDCSVHKTKRKFAEAYGSDGELLALCNNRIAQFEASTTR